MMGALTRRRDRIRRITTWLALASIAALLALPGVALAVDNLVATYSLPADWLVVIENNATFWARNTYGSGGGTLSYDIEWSGFAEVKADIVMPGDTYSPHFASFEDFSAGSSTVPIGEDDEFWADKRTWAGAQRTTLGGLEAFVNRATVRQESSEGATAHYADYWVYWVPTPDDGGIIVTAEANVSWSEEEPWSGTNYGSQLGPVSAEVDSLLSSLGFGSDGAASGPVAPAAPGDSSPWRTVGAGIGAVAAAAVALAGAAASTRAKTGAEEPPPGQPVGYILQLSGRSLQLSAAHSATFTAQVFRVLANGSYQPASDAAIILHPPAGVSVQPQTAYGALQTTVWQTGPIAAGAAITIEAQSSLGATTASISVAAAGESRIVTRIEPAGTLALRTQGEHSITLVAAVELLDADATDPALDPAAVRATIKFAEDSEWLEMSEAVDYEDGRAVRVMASQPDPTSPVQPPESATIRVTAQLGERPLTELVAIPLAGLPEMDAKPDEISFAAESGSVAEVAITVTNAGDTPWQFDTLWREGSRAIAMPSIEPTDPSAATLTLTEDGGDNLDPAHPQTASTLVVVATADGYDELRRHVEVIVTQEGLFIDRTNVDPTTGAYPLAADGSARPTEVDLRVFVRDTVTGEIAPDIALAQQATLEIGGTEGTSGYAGLKAGGLSVEPAGVRQLNVPSATFSVSLERTLPTAGEPVPAALLASVPGYDADRFSALVPLRLLGVDMEPYSDAWETERDNCLDIIRGFVPFEHQDRLYALVAERSRTMGAEGLFVMRKQIWSFAHDQIMKEKHEHLDAAWWAQQIEDTLDWVSWCGDIALGVVTGSAMGVVGGMAVGLLKPLLVSAMEVWLAGGSLEDWLMAQTSTLTGVLEGSLTDPDFLTKLSGDKKAIAWALFMAYYFAKELYNDPQMSVTNAAKNMVRQLRDEGLVRFLTWIATRKGIAPKATKADADAPKQTGSDADTPDAARPKAGTDAGTPDTAARPRSAAETPATRHGTPEADGPRTPDAETARPAEPDTSGAPDADLPRTPDDAGADAAKRDADMAEPPAKTPEAEAKPEQKPAEGPADKPAEKPAEKASETDTDPRASDPDPAKRAKNISEDIAAKTAGGKPLDVPTVERIMRDPDAMRNLRKSDPEGWRKFNETRQKVYKAHDAELREWARKNLSEGQDHEIAVHTVGHVDGVDRDYRLGYFTKDPSGHNRFIEIPREKWNAESQRIFSEKTGGPSDAKGAERWSAEHQQLQTDYRHEEASIDMADQGTVYDPKTGEWKETRFTPNDQMVKDGHSTLIDPEGYGATYRTKVMNSYKQGNTLDAYTQANKAVGSLDEIRSGYTKQGYAVGDLDPNLTEAGNVVGAAKSGSISVQEANAHLARLGYTDGLPSFMDAITRQYADLESAKKVM